MFYEDNVVLSFSDKSDGDLSFCLPEEDDARAHWQCLPDVMRLGLNDPVFAQQIHGKDVLHITHRPEVLCFGSGDALITDLFDLPVGVFSADCLPLLFWSPSAIAAAHAGWRGTCQNIAAATVAAFQKHYSIGPEQIKVAIGPCIGSCCLELGDEVFFSFTDASSEYQKYFVRKHKWQLDLPALNRFQLIKAGVKEENIQLHHQCTFCNDERFYSYRRQKKRNGSMFSFVVKRSPN